MSWFDTVNIASFAKSALNTAQKTIDKALDIKDEHISKLDKKINKKPEADNFFEAFGLGEKPSTSQESVLSHQTENVNKEIILETSPNQNEFSSQGSGFWTDTWGSIFEMKGPATTKSDPETNDPLEKTIPNPDQVKKDAVLSQPHRASLFPIEPNVPELPKEESINVQDIGGRHEEEILDGDLKFPDKQLSLDDSDATLTESNNRVATEKLSSEQPTSVELIVTEQPFSLAAPDTEISTFNVDCQTSTENKPLEPIPSNENDNESFYTVPHPRLQDVVINTSPEPRSDIFMDQSEYINIEIPPPPSASCISEKQNLTNMDISSDSFTHIETSDASIISVESPLPEEKIALDLPATTESVENWECSVQSTDSLYIVGENTCCQESQVTDNAKVTISRPDGFVHPVADDSFNNNQLWVEPDETDHSNYENVNLTNEEHQFQHSDCISSSSKDDDTDTAGEAKEYDTKSSSSSGSHTTSSSFVKCSLEETDSNSHRGQSPISTTASEKSDATKQESEQNLSGDEIETATSSDIEILSPSNGENGDRNTSPLKHVWLQRSLRLRGSESPPSDSSKEGSMPVVSELDEVQSSHSAYEEKALASDKHFGEHETLEKLFQKQTELQNVLDAREKKLIELSKENVELQENEERLKKLIQKMRIDQEKESKGISTLTREFTQKLSKVENQLKVTVKERDKFLIELEQTKDDLSKRVSAADVESVILEKDTKIQELLEEGHKLSKKELQLSTVVKKLRSKKEELEQTTQSQEQKLDESTKEVERLRKSISAKEEQEKKHIDAIRESQKVVLELEKEVSALASNQEDSLEKEKSLKSSLDSTYKDLASLRIAYAAKESEVEDLKSGLELEAKENLQHTLESANKEAAKERDHLLLQINDLRCSISQSENEANSREKMLRDEIASLQKRLQEAEVRNEDLAKNMSSATRPLVRQMENLQSTFTAQTISWEKIEKNLTDRLSDAQNQNALLSEKERAANDKYMTLQSRVTALDLQNSSLRQEKLQLSAEIESLQTKIIMLEENVSRESYTIEKLKQNNNSEITRLKQEKVNLENTMGTCLEQLDSEKRKVSKLEEEIKIKEARALIMSGSSPCASPTGSVRSSVSSIHNWSQDEPQDLGTATPINSYRMSVYESLRLGSGSSLLENLQSQLKQREGEIFQLQFQISKLEQVKESMTRELVALSEQNEELDKRLNELEDIEKQHKDLDQKYNTLLQMYGEKVEETEELQLDLADVKTMYKAQIEELLTKK